MLPKTLTLTLILGWLFGIFFLKKPWALPQPIKRFSFHVLYIFLLNTLVNFLWFRICVTFGYQYIVRDHSNILQQAMHAINLMLAVGHNMIIRVIMAIRAQDLIQLAHRLKTCPIKATPSSWKFPRLVTVTLNTIFFTLAVMMTFIFSIYYPELYKPVEIGAVMKFLTQTPGLSFFLALFEFASVIMTETCGFLLFTTSTYYISRIYDTMIENVVELVTLEFGIGPTNERKIDVEVFRKKAHFTALGEWSAENEEKHGKSLTEQLLQQFTEFQELYECYRRVVSPLILFLICFSVVRIIGAVYGVLLSGHDTAELALDLLSALSQLIVLFTLEICESVENHVSDQRVS